MKKWINWICQLKKLKLTAVIALELPEGPSALQLTTEISTARVYI